MKIEVSNGEIIDKLTIIEIKLSQITDPEKRKNLQKEYEVLETSAAKIIPKSHQLYKALYQVNRKLWDIEDKIRELERNKDFGKAFIELARAVYHENDHRAALKREINEITGSGLREEKSYKPY